MEKHSSRSIGSELIGENMTDEKTNWGATAQPKPNKLTNSQQKITTVCDEMKKMLLQKNEQYGDSVLNPNRFFSHASQDEQIKVRIDDKLNRLILGNDSLESDEDIIKDLIGYLTLLLVYNRIE